MLTCSRLLVLFSIALTAFWSPAWACTCIGSEYITPASELYSSDLVAKGRIISATDYVQYDTIALSARGVRYDPAVFSYLVRHYRKYQLLIDKKLKGSDTTPDTVQIITGFGGGDCGYEFKIGKEYIVCAKAWPDESIVISRKKKRIKRKLITTKRTDIFSTDVCTLTQEATPLAISSFR